MCRTLHIGIAHIASAVSGPTDLSWCQRIFIYVRHLYKYFPIESQFGRANALALVSFSAQCNNTMGLATIDAALKLSRDRMLHFRGAAMHGRGDIELPKQWHRTFYS